MLPTLVGFGGSLPKVPMQKPRESEPKVTGEWIASNFFPQAPISHPILCPSWLSYRRRDVNIRPTSNGLSYSCIMSSKRDHSDFDDGEISEPEHQPVPKRAKQPSRSAGSSSKSRQHQNSAIDSTWGQKYVFSNYADATTIPPGEESDFEDDADAMAYLMSVR